MNRDNHANTRRELSLALLEIIRSSAEASAFFCNFRLGVASNSQQNCRADPRRIEVLPQLLFLHFAMGDSVIVS